jgi:1-hydroxycarotenoid 3,4-desaturase
VTWNLLAPTRGFPLSRHTVFFSDDSAAEFTDIFGRGSLPSAPTVYVCAQDRADDDATAPTGAERLLLIVNAPASGDKRPNTAEELSRCEAQAFLLMERCGMQVQHTPERTLITTPQDFDRLFPATGGALYGQASHGWAASFRRQGARCRLQGLYLAGGSVHPGPGVPMAALSGRQAAASVMADRALAHPASNRPSTSPSRPAAMPGGTSTR